MPQELKGIIVPVITPFHEDESLNEDGLRQIVDYLIAGGVHGIFPCGSQSELFALSMDEAKRVIDVAVAAANGRVPVLAGTGMVTTRDSIELSRYAESAGADALSVITPYFIKPTPEELRKHFLRICEAVSIPVLGYNNPGRTGVPLTPATVAAIAKEAPNFVGIKDSSGDLTNTLSYIEQTPPTFRAFMGRDTLVYAALCYGCVGAVAATANVVPELVVGIYDAYMAGDHALALQRQHQLSPLRLAFELGSFPVVVKDAMNLIGLPAGPARAPITSLTGQPREKLVAVLKELGKL